MNRQELLEKLELVGRALASDNLVPMFQCFCFDTKQVCCFNDQIAITAPCKTKEAFAVNGKVLLGLLQNCNAKSVDFSIEDDLVITADDSIFKLPWFPKTDFLFVEPETSDGEDLTLNTDVIAGIEECLLTSAKDNAQAAFNGVWLTGDKLYSTDGDAISRYVLDAASSARGMLPSTFCDILTKVRTDGLLTLTADWAIADLNSGYTVCARLIQVDNPLDHEAEIKKTLKGKITYQPVPDGLTNALSRARVLSDIESVPTQLTIENSVLTLLTRNQMGVVHDEIAFTHPDVQANVSAEMIQRCAGMGYEMAIMENCCVFKQGEKLFILTSNMGE